MHFGNDEADRFYERWLPDYVDRSSVVRSELSQLFQQAVQQEDDRSIDRNHGASTSLEFLRKRREEFPDRIVFFIYSSRFDINLEQELVDPSYTSALAEGLTSQEIFDRKAQKLVRNFKTFTFVTDELANHFVVAMMAKDIGLELPLVWEVPVHDERKTGYSPEAMWWVTFQYLCEVSRAIVAYGGFTRHLLEELRYIRHQPHLRRRLLWLDQDLELFFPDCVEEVWPLTDIGLVLEKLDS